MKRMIARGLLCGIFFSASPPLAAQLPPTRPQIDETSVVVRWWALVTDDAKKASDFYRELFGVQILNRGDGIYQIQRGGTITGSITQAQFAAGNIKKSAWTVGFRVPDVKTAVERARAQGGTILDEPTSARTVNAVTSEEGTATWAAIEDPGGAQFLVINYDRDLGVPPEEGALVWAELWTTDPDASISFYERVFDWEKSDTDHPNGQYPVFKSGGKARAGMVPISMEGSQLGWAPYVGVMDIQKTVERVTELGGRVLFRPDKSLLHGRVAVVSDPTGADFLLYQLQEGK